MNNNHKLLLLFVILCQSCSQSIVINSVIPEPLVTKIENISLGITYDKNIQDYQFMNTNSESGEPDIKIDLINSQVNLFNKILKSYFPDLVELPSNNSEIYTDIDLYMDAKLDAFELLSPTVSGNDKYAVWLKYKVILYDNKKTLLSNWYITGYGEQPIGSRLAESLTRAVDLALRDVGVNLIIQIEDDFDKFKTKMSEDS